LVGYSARTINPIEKLRYIMRKSGEFVFGMDFIKEEHSWVIVQEGLFDAISINGLAVMHNEISERQAELIQATGKQIIVVPDMNKAGLSKNENSLIQTAIDYGWSVSFPEWPYEDVNDAYVRYGKLFCIQHILNNKISDSLTIRLKQKLCGV
jgi:hypothetical protein